jgi:hypothetical protein
LAVSCVIFGSCCCRLLAKRETGPWTAPDQSIRDYGAFASFCQTKPLAFASC